MRNVGIGSGRVMDSGEPAVVSRGGVHASRAPRWRHLVTAFCAAALLSSCGGAGEPSGAAEQVAGAAVAHDKRALAAAGSFTGNGWYWNPLESGTGFMFEAQGSRGFVGFFMYEEGTGNPIWYVAYGNLIPGDADGAYTFTGSLGVSAGGRPLFSTADTAPAPSLTTIGNVTIQFSGSRAQVLLPGGRTMAAERFPINGSFIGQGGQPRQPEVGWYWNPAEGGRGYAIEVQDNQVFMAAFHYNLDGSPTWNIFQGDITTGVAVDRLQMTSGGQSLTSAHRGGVRDLLGPFTMSFRNPCAGQMQLYGAPPIKLRRFPIDGSPLPASSECAALDNLADVPDIATSVAEVTAGESVFGRIDSAGDADGFRVAMSGGTTYTFDLQGAPSQAGTLANPSLELYGPDLSLQTLNDDRGDGSLSAADSRIVFTPNQSGVYRLRAMSSGGAGVGTYLLTVSGVAPGLAPHVPAPVASYEGGATARLRGVRPGAFVLAVLADGKVGGTLVYDNAPAAVVALDGTVAAGGTLRLTASDGVVCTGFLSAGSLQGSCGAAGVLAGGFTPRGASTATIAGVVTGLGSSERLGTALLLNGGSPLYLTGNGSSNGAPFEFPTTVPFGEIYRLGFDVPSGGAAPLCTITNGIGVVSGNVGHVAVACISQAATNRPPIARAGAAQTVPVGSVVTVDGTTSSDPEQSRLSFNWVLSSKPTGSAAAVDPVGGLGLGQFTADLPGNYRLTLTVSDGELTSTPSSVNVTAIGAGGNTAPIARAGNAQSVAVGATVTLDGRASSDAQGDPLAYTWTLTTRPPGSAAVLSSSSSATPTFVADVAGSYGASLTVSDGRLSSSPSSVGVTASTTPTPPPNPTPNTAPVANPGAAQTVPVGVNVTLDGSASTDAQGDPLTYAWTLTARPTGSTATLSSATAARPSFVADVVGAYVASLTVNDGRVNSTAATVTVTAASDVPAPFNALPVQSLTPATQAATVGTTVTVDGSASRDPEGAPIIYIWTLLKPEGSNTTLLQPTSARPSFIPDLPGTYYLILSVSDGQMFSKSKSVATINVSAR